MSLNIGDPFPTVPVYGPAGSVDLADRWSSGRLVVAFHRLWCPFCQQALKELQDSRGLLESAGANAVVIYKDDVATVAEKCADRGVAFDCLSDPGHSLERAAQIAPFRASRYASFAPTKLITALRAGGRIGVPTEILEGRATYVVDSHGKVAYVHVSENAADIPPIGEIIHAATAAP